MKPDSSNRIQGELQPMISSLHTDSNKLKLSIILSDSTIYNTSIPISPKPNPFRSKTLLWLILLIGAVGSSLHGLNSLSNYIGNQDFKSSWAFWYILRPFVGAILAFIFYLTIRAGFFKQFDSKEEFYVIVALAALIGLFSKSLVLIGLLNAKSTLSFFVLSETLA